MAIKRASKNDIPRISEILKELDIDFKAQTFDHFVVAEEDEKIVGVAKLEEFKDFYFLSSVGVPIKHQHKGIAALLLSHLLQDIRKDVYIYTTIPDFFEKFGFKKAETFPNLPSKDLLECAECFPEKCMTMVKKVEK